MSAHASTRFRITQSPLERALLVWLGAVALAGGAWLGAMYSAPDDARTLVAWGGGATVLLLCAAVGVAVYFAQSVRVLGRQAAHDTAQAQRLEQEVAQAAEETLPRLVRLIREGASAEAALGEVVPPGSLGLQRMLHMAAWELGAAEQRGSAAAAACVTNTAEADRLVDELLPVLVRRMRTDRASADTVLAELTQPSHEGLQRVLFAVAEELGNAERRGMAAMTACANAAARVQAQSTRLLADLRDMENRYSEDKVFADLLDLDHRISQMGRLADSIALLSGGRSGRRWTKPIRMESILRGAMGRIDAYRRVRLHSTGTVAVVGHAAEGVMHTIAELMDNAATFSAHGTEVHVYMEEEDAGAVILIEDGGLGMRRRERSRAETLVSSPLDLTTLSGTRLGLAVVGRLADKYGLTVSFRPSSRGGTGVVVMIPRQLITQQRPEPAPLPPVQVPVARTATTGPVEPELDGDWAGMPRRRRGETLAAASRPTQQTGAQQTGTQQTGTQQPLPDRAATGAKFAAFRRSAESGQPAPDTE
ncbi:MAG: ATP-binding protein [Streptosporangiaceae bacterium]